MAIRKQACLGNETEYNYIHAKKNGLLKRILQARLFAVRFCSAAKFTYPSGHFHPAKC